MKRLILAAMAACMVMGSPPAYPQGPTPQHQIIEQLRPQCRSLYDAAVNSIRGSNTPQGRAANGAQVELDLASILQNDAQILLEIHIPYLTKRAAETPVYTPQFRYQQCILLARVRQLSAGGPGVVRPRYDDPFNVGSNGTRFLANDLRRFCRTEFDAVLRGSPGMRTMLEDEYLSAADNHEDVIRGLLRRQDSRTVYGRFAICLFNARLQQIQRLRTGALTPPSWGNVGLAGPLIPANDPPPPAPPPPVTASNPPVTAPPPVPGAASGTLGGGRGVITYATVKPKQWEGRRLELPPAYAHLKPTNALINHFPDGGVNIWIGKDKESARRTELRYIAGRNWNDDPKMWDSCWETPEEVKVAWFAYVLVAHQLPPAWTVGQGQFTEVFVCGGATLEETLSVGYDAAKEHAQGKPFMTYLIHAGLTAEIDYEPIRQRGTFPNGMRPAAMAPWSFWCLFPSNIEEAQGTFMPRDPGSGPAFAQYLTGLPTMRRYTFPYLTMDRKKAITHTAQFGCLRDMMTPLPHQPGPVLIRR